MKLNALLKLLKNDGWIKITQKGSHIQFKHPTKKGRVTVPNHSKNIDLPKGTENSILKQAGLK